MGKGAVHAYVEKRVRSEFKSYREQCGLSTDAALLGLLLLRELKRRRLKSRPPASPISASRTSRPRSSTITTNIDENSARDFFAYAQELGHSASGCAASLAEQELEERWLLCAFMWSPSR